MASTGVCNSVSALMVMTERSGLSSRARRVISNPFMPGSRTSVIIKSNDFGAFRKTVSACTADDALVHSQCCCASASAATLRTCGSSSTIRTLAGESCGEFLDCSEFEVIAASFAYRFTVVAPRPRCAALVGLRNRLGYYLDRPEGRLL